MTNSPLPSRLQETADAGECPSVTIPAIEYNPNSLTGQEHHEDLENSPARLHHEDLVQGNDNATLMNSDEQITFHCSIYHYFLRLDNQQQQQLKQVATPLTLPFDEVVHPDSHDDLLVQRSEHEPTTPEIPTNSYRDIVEKMIHHFPYLADITPPPSSPSTVELRFHSEYKNHVSRIQRLQHEITTLEQEKIELQNRLETFTLDPILVMPTEQCRKRQGDDLDVDNDFSKRARNKNSLKPLSIQTNIGKRNDVPDDIKELVVTMRRHATNDKRNTNKKLDRLKKQVEALATEKEQLQKEKEATERKRKEAESNTKKAATPAKPRPRTEAEIAEEIKKSNGTTGPLTEEERAQFVARKLELAMAGIPTESITAPTWDERCEELMHFHKGYNHCRVPVRTPGLGRWVAQMRADYRNIMSKSGAEQEQLNSTDAWSLNAERIEILTKLGFEFQLSEVVPWELRFNELVDFKDVHGHCKVPRGYKENIKLSEWVHMQRKNYRKKLPSIMGERCDKLNGLGFLWDIKKANPSFEERMEQLRDFRREHGHLDVPLPPLPPSHQRLDSNEKSGDQDGADHSNMDDNNDGESSQAVVEGGDLTSIVEVAESAAADEDATTDPEVISFRRWVQRQRDEYNTCYLVGKKCSLDKVRVKKLEELGFTFERVRKSRGAYNPNGHLGRRADPDKYSSRIEKLRIVKEICGDCNKAREIFPDDQILIDWMKAQRKQWKNWQEGRKSSLTTERRQQLEGLGFVWQPRCHYAPYGSKVSERRSAKAETEAAAASMAQFSHQDYHEDESQV